MSSIGTELDALTASNSSALANSRKTSAPKADFAKILADFNKAAHQTQYDRVRDAVLKKNKMTEEDFNNLNGLEKDKINQEIQEAIKRAALQSQGMSATAAATVASSDLLA